MKRFLAAWIVSIALLVATPAVGDVVRGTRHNDFLTGTNGPDQISGLRGRDEIRAESGADHLLGGRGPDTLVDQGGMDVSRGGAGDDLFIVGGGSDHVFGGRGRDSFDVHRDGFLDVFNCGPGNDTVGHTGRLESKDEFRGCEHFKSL